MSDVTHEAPERVWIWGWRTDSVWQEQTWQHEDEPMSTMEYVRADRIEALTKELNTCRMAQAVMDNTVADLEAKLAEFRHALFWCGGSADFNEGGVAREGWLKVCAPLLKGESHE